MAAIQVTVRLLFHCVAWNLRATSDFLGTKERGEDFCMDVWGEEGENTLNSEGQTSRTGETKETVECVMYPLPSLSIKLLVNDSLSLRILKSSDTVCVSS